MADIFAQPMDSCECIYLLIRSENQHLLIAERPQLRVEVNDCGGYNSAPL